MPRCCVFDRTARRRCRRLIAAIVVVVLGSVTAVVASEPAAVVNGVLLEQWEVDRDLAQLIATGSFHKRVPEERRRELECRAVAGLVIKELKRQWAQRTELAVDPAVAEAAWREVKDRFESDAQYRSALETKGIIEADFLRAFDRDAAAEAVDAVVLRAVAEPTADQVEVYFSLHQDEYRSPEARHVVHALVHVSPSASVEEWQQAEQRAGDLVRGVDDDGGSLAEAARLINESLPPRLRDQVGDMGFVHRGSLLPTVDEAVFAVAPGGLTDPIRTIYGFHVLQVLEVREPEPLELDQVRDAVERQIFAERRRKALEAFESGLQKDAVVKDNRCVDGP